jgi:tRNA (guanine-N7-)-methyltransferase
MSSRIRRHVNPFKYPIQLNEEDWIEKYLKHNGPLCVDLGCGKGEFVAELAKSFPDKFFVGVEIRNKVAERYFGRYTFEPNLVLLCGNINLSLAPMFGRQNLRAAYINFPGPYTLKKKHQKRRMVNAQLVSDLHGVMNRDGQIHVQTDDASLFKDMHSLFLKKFSCITDAQHPENVENAAGTISEWEQECMKKNLPIYRGIYQRTD